MINLEVAKKVLSAVDAGLVKGVGNPVPGQMCVEAAVCYALGLPHGDDPKCVAPALRQLKIRLNDSNWSSNDARAKGLRRLALAQLGSAGVLDETEFAKHVARLAIQKALPAALRAAASCHKDPKHQAALNAAADKCARDADRKSAQEARAAAAAADDAAAAAAYAAAAYAAAAADAAAYAYAAAADDAAAYAYAAAAYAAAAADDAAAAAAYADDDKRDALLAEFAEGVVQILIEMDAPGCQWLVLTAEQVTLEQAIKAWRDVQKFNKDVGYNQSVVDYTIAALERLQVVEKALAVARQHIDLDALHISHIKDWAVIEGSKP